MDRYSKSNERKALKEEYAKYCTLYLEAHDKQKEICFKLNSTKDSMKIINYKRDLKRVAHKIDIYRDEKVKLSKELDDSLKTSIPLLLFAINESRYSLNGNFEPVWEYVYYYADCDEIVKKTRLGTLTLNKNDVNLTDLFYDLGMPEQLPGSGISNNYDEIINNAVDITKVLIDQIFDENDINDWKDVSAHLKKYVETKNKIDQIKGIKHLKLI